MNTVIGYLEFEIADAKDIESIILPILNNGYKLQAYPNPEKKNKNIIFEITMVK